MLLDASMNPILVNHAAAQILAYPQSPDAHKNVDSYLATRVRSTLLSERPDNGAALVSRFQSGRRIYSCRGFWVNAVRNGHQASLAVLLERASSRSGALAQLVDKFHLTAREQEVAQFLLQGLTSKEIGVRMQISANTVKAFLRLIMVKMGCSTRAGVVGKALTIEQ
jgi:DNA-binding CsgD family transcriptional regulator